MLLGVSRDGGGLGWWEGGTWSSRSQIQDVLF